MLKYILKKLMVCLDNFSILLACHEMKAAEDCFSRQLHLLITFHNSTKNILLLTIGMPKHYVATDVCGIWIQMQLQ